jgi:predicted RND superfamily exporter protein
MWVGVGLALVWLIVLTLFPALQRILKTPTHVERPTAATWFHSLAKALPRFSYRYRWLWVGASLLLSTAGVVSVFGLGKRIAPMSAITEPIEYVSRDTDVYRDTDFARKHLPGLSVTNVWIKTDKKELLVEPEILEGLHDFEERLSNDPEVGSVVGLPKFLRIMRYTTHEGDAWPEDADELTETLETLGGDASRLPPQMKLAQEALKPFINITSGQNQTQFTVVSNAREHEAYDHLKSRIELHWAEMVKTHPALDPDKQKDPASKITIETVGLGPLQAKMSRSLVPTLIQSFALTAGIIFITFLILFRSGAARVMTMVPSLFAILVMFLAMRGAGMGANIATILIASTVLGTSENDQIHFFYHFSEGRKRGTVTQALEHTFLVSGKAIFFATIINAGGFLAFAVSDLRPMRQFGALTALALVLSMIADFTALPAALWIVFRAKVDPPAKPGDELPAETRDDDKADANEPAARPSTPEEPAGKAEKGGATEPGAKSAPAEPESPASS